MRNVLLVARFAWREAVARRLVVAILLLTLVFVGVYLYGTNALLQSFQRRAADLGRELPGQAHLFANATLVLMGMYIANFLGSLMAVFTTIAAVSGEVDSGTIQSVLPKPIRRWEFVLGKWLGHLSLVLPYIVLLSLALMYGAQAITGYLPPQPFNAIAIMLLSTLFLLTLTLLGSTLFSTLTTGIVMFMLYGLGWAGGIVGSVGALTGSKTLQQIGEISGYAVPSDQLWRGASVYLQPDALRQVQDVARGNPFVGTEPLAAGYLLWVGLYTLLLLLLAVWIFRRRDF